MSVTMTKFNNVVSSERSHTTETGSTHVILCHEK